MRDLNIVSFLARSLAHLGGTESLANGGSAWDFQFHSLLVRRPPPTAGRRFRLLVFVLLSIFSQFVFLNGSAYLFRGEIDADLRD